MPILPPDEGYEDEPPSKTARKKAMHALQDTGKRLTTLKVSQLAKLELPEKLLQALAEFRRLPNSHGARRRQLQYIGRLMRELGLEHVEDELESLLSPPPQDPGRLRRQEQFRERILEDGDPAINGLLAQHPALDRQKLRKFHLDFRKASEAGADDRCAAARERLSQYLQENMA